MNGKKISVILGVVFITVGLAYWYYSNQLKKLFSYSWDIKNLKFTRVGNGKVEMDIVAQLTNPSEIKLEVSGLFIKIYVSNQLVGTVTDVNPFVVESQGQYDLPMHISFNAKDFIGNWVALLKDLRNTKDLPLKFEGYATVKYGIKTKIPFTYNTTIKEYLSS